MNDTSGTQKIARHMGVVLDEGSQGVFITPIQQLDVRAFIRKYHYNFVRDRYIYTKCYYNWAPP